MNNETQWMLRHLPLLIRYVSGWHLAIGLVDYFIQNRVFNYNTCTFKLTQQLLDSHSAVTLETESILGMIAIRWLIKYMRLERNVGKKRRVIGLLRRYLSTYIFRIDEPGGDLINFCGVL